MKLLAFLYLMANEECTPKCQEVVTRELQDRINRIGPNSFVTMSAELIKKENDLKMKELELKKREEEMQLSETELGRKIASFNTEQERLINCLNTNKEEEDKRIKQMVEVISNMRPEAAAKLLNIQDDKIAVKLLAVLSADKVAKIFNLMDPEVSVKLQKQYMTMYKK